MKTGRRPESMAALPLIWPAAIFSPGRRAFLSRFHCVDLAALSEREALRNLQLLSF
jgi:hypothetical protein